MAVLRSSPIVHKRCMILLGGYEPIPPDRQYHRFVRELQRFERTWNVAATASDVMLSPDGLVASWQIETQGPNWRVDTDYVLLRWDDMVATDFARSEWSRISGGIVSLIDFIVSGTAFRYFATNWRYGVFFVYPIMLLLAFAALAILAGYGWIRFELPYAALIAPLVSIGIFAGLLRWPGRPMYLAYILDDWIYADELTRWNRTDLDARVDRFAAELVARMGDQSYDEVVFGAQSFGAAMQPEVVDRALRIAPNLGKVKRLNLLSTGSSLLKVGLHPSARWLRDAVTRVSSHPAIFWVEYQARADIINFFKVDPIAAMGLPRTGKPIVQNARIRNMLEKRTYRRFQLDFFRLHRQLGMANDVRYYYDYLMICCGPVALETRAMFPDSMVGLFTADGSFLGAQADTKADTARSSKAMP
ncbi:MAG: hypothetical protein HY659_14295 [Rhizobiales bacterium]|nr:hypothetical protein [Hyphomicrobiales bacterium]